MYAHFLLTKIRKYKSLKYKITSYSFNHLSVSNNLAYTQIKCRSHGQTFSARDYY